MNKHNYHAKLVNGKSIKVYDENDNEVKVEFGATSDYFTVTAYIPREGFIGGWTCGTGPTPKTKKAPEWRKLVESINAGILYPSSAVLPNSYGRPTKEQLRFRRKQQ